MKNTRLTITIAITALMVSGISMADVTTNEEAKPDDWNHSVKVQPMNTIEAGKETGKVATISKENLLRCWQHGDLIVLENDWKPVDSSKGSLMRNGSKRLHAYDYGETFCIYLGG